MNKLPTSDKIYVSRSKTVKGQRGVFAKVDIQKGDVIESCPVVEIPPHEAEHVNKSILVTYIYYLGKNKERLWLALGYGSIYNHSYKPNTRYEEKYKDKIINFIAKNKIKKNEEITVDYSKGNKKKNSPLWFNAA